MPTDRFGETDGVVIELRGEFSKRDLHRIIDGLGTGDIRAFHVEITPADGTREPLSLLDGTGSDSGPARSDRDDPTTGEERSPSGNGDDRIGAVAEEASDHDTKSEASTVDDDSEPSPRLHANSGAHQVATFLAEQDTWLRTKEIRKSIPDAGELSPETLGSTLWRLADRNLVEKRPYETDKRQTEYRITDIGREAVERVDTDSVDETATDDTQVVQSE